MTRDELDQLIYDRTRCFVHQGVLDCILELIAAEREACAKAVEAEAHMFETFAAAKSCANAIRSRGEKND